MCRLAQFASLVIAATVGLHVAGCESSSASRHRGSSSAGSSVPSVSQQLILKFRPKSVSCTAQDIARFSHAVDVPLAWLRPMSGDACVVIQQAGAAAELTKGQEKLRKHGDIEWLEIDALMQRHPK